MKTLTTLIKGKNVKIRKRNKHDCLEALRARLQKLAYDDLDGTSLDELRVRIHLAGRGNWTITVMADNAVNEYDYGSIREKVITAFVEEAAKDGKHWS